MNISNNSQHSLHSVHSIHTTAVTVHTQLLRMYSTQCTSTQEIAGSGVLDNNHNIHSAGVTKPYFDTPLNPALVPKYKTILIILSLQQQRRVTVSCTDPKNLVNFENAP